jgi:hypothetical protein
MEQVEVPVSDFHKGDKPRKGDKVRIGVDAEYVREGDPADHDGGFAGWIVTIAGAMVYLPTDATVEVLERADDPSKDPIGTVRRRPDGVVAAKSPNPDYPWRGFGEPCGENFATVSVIGWPIIGSVPGTPAAEAEKQPVVDRPPVHVDNEAIVTGQYGSRKGDGPRYFQGHSGTRQWKINPDGVAFYRTTSDQEWALCDATIAVLSHGASVREVDSLDGEPS